MAEVLCNEARIAELLPKPGRGGMPQGVRRYVLLEAGARCGSVDDCGKRRRLEPATGEAAEHGCLGSRTPLGSDGAKLAGEPGRKRLATRLATLAPADEQRRRGGVELEVTPFERAQLGATQAGRDQRKQRKPVALDEAGEVALGTAGGLEQTPKLVLLEPVALLPGFRRRLEVEERIGHTVPPAHPTKEAAQEDEATIIGRGCGLGALLVGGEVVDDRSFLEELAAARFGPCVSRSSIALR